MEQERIKLLEQFAQDEPDDPFNWYALALEVGKGNSTRALEIFEFVLRTHPNYLATYYQAGNLCLSMGNLERAKEILQAGVILANQKGEHKSMNELTTLLNEFID